MEATRERPFQYLVCRDLDPQTRERVIADLENISKLLGEFKNQIGRSEVKELYVCTACGNGQEHPGLCCRCGAALREHKPNPKLYGPSEGIGKKASPNPVVQRVRKAHRAGKQPVPKLQ